jgi:hypothetical protein
MTFFEFLFCRSCHGEEHSAYVLCKSLFFLIKGSLCLQVVTTISQGNIVWNDGVLNVKEGAGRLLKLPVGGPLFEGLDEIDASYVASTFPYGELGKPVKRNLEAAAPRDEL